MKTGRILRFDWKGWAVGANTMEINLPPGSRVVHFGWQVRGDLPVWSIWVLCPTEGEERPTQFMITATGEEVDISRWQWVGTAKAIDNFHMWHLFVRE
jgi:hypothetical protein